MTRHLSLILLCCMCLGFLSASAADVRTLKLTGDGKVDDTAALQTALDAGRTDLYFPQGEYLLGSVKLPVDTHLSFDPRAKIKPKVEGLVDVSAENVAEGKKAPHIKALFIATGNRVRIEGLRFDFSAGGAGKDATPVDYLVYAHGVADLLVSDVHMETSQASTSRKDNRILIYADHCRNVVMENSSATGITHMLFARGCANVTARGNWMIGGADMTTFADGSENLRHHDNWSRNVGYQCVWRGGSPDPSRKAPRVPLGSATVVKRGVKQGDPGWNEHTVGAFDVMVENNYAEYGTTMCWGNKGRQVIVQGNTARFMWDYSYGTEGGEELIFANNISINSSVAGICSLYYGDKLLITGNMVIVRHEVMDPAFTNRPESVYLGQFIRLHHGPPNPEDRYGAGTVQITGNLFINELADRPSGISIEGGRDVLVNNNKFINGVIRKHEELGRVKQSPADKEADTSEFASTQQTNEPKGGEAVGEGKLVRRIGTDMAKVTIMGNEFISRQATDKVCVLVGGSTTAAVVKDNVFRREPSVVPITEAQKAVEKEPARYMLYTDDSTTKMDVTDSHPSAAVVVAPVVPGLSLVQGNLVYGWKDALDIRNSTSQEKLTLVVSGNTSDGTIVVDGPADRTTKKVEGNIQIPPAPSPTP